jgi:hypothetical protein
MSRSPVQQIIDIGRMLRSGFCCEGRLHALLVPTAPSIAAKAESARLCFDALTRAVETDQFFRAAFPGSLKDHLVEWPESIISALPESDDSAGIHSLLLQVSGSCRSLLAKLADLSMKHFVLDHVGRWSARMLKEVPAGKRARIDFSTPSRPANSVAPRKVLEGPKQQTLDKRYRRGISARKYQATFIDDPHLVVRYFWCLSSREGVASDLAALNIAEYDLMPLEFYWDSAKQVYDEARHAKTYFDLSISLYRSVAHSLPRDSEIRKEMDPFLKSGKALPIPAEGNHYPVVHAASLVERLVLMNVMTETPAVGRKRENLRSGLAASYPQVATVIETDLYDEMFHAILGKKWLEYLFPDKTHRDEAIMDAALLRGFLFTLSVAEGENSDPITLLREATSPNTGFQPTRFARG